jgi:hypothetical protein
MAARLSPGDLRGEVPGVLASVRARGSLRLRFVVARRRPPAGPATALVRRRLTLLPLGGEARRQVGSQRATGASEPRRQRGGPVCRTHSRARGSGFVAAHRADRGADDARPGGDSPPRIHARYPMVGPDLAHVPSHAVRHDRQPASRPATEAARPILPGPSPAPSVAVAGHRSLEREQWREDDRDRGGPQGEDRKVGGLPALEPVERAASREEAG